MSASREGWIFDPPVALDRSDFLDQPGAADQQILDGVVDAIDFGADFVESSFSAHLPFRNALSSERPSRYRRSLTHNGTVGAKQRKR